MVSAFVFLQYLLARWLKDNPPAEEKPQQEDKVEPPVHNSDAVALATTLNSLPDPPRSSRIITMPKHFVPFSRPRVQERPRPPQVDGDSSCNKVSGGRKDEKAEQMCQKKTHLCLLKACKKTFTIVLIFFFFCLSTAETDK